MTPQQLRHAKSLARHIRTHSESLTREMQSVESLKERDVQDYPVATMIERLETDVRHAIKEMEQVLTDMLGELEGQ